MRLTQGIDSRIDLAALAFEVADLRRDLLRQQTHLEFRLAGILSPASKDVMNLGQRESELLAFKYHLEVKPVAGIITGDWCFPVAGATSRGPHKTGGPGCSPENPAPFPGPYINANSLPLRANRPFVFPNRHVRLGRAGAT